MPAAHGFRCFETASARIRLTAAKRDGGGFSAVTLSSFTHLQCEIVRSNNANITVAQPPAWLHGPSLSLSAVEMRKRRAGKKALLKQTVSAVVGAAHV